MPFTISVHNIQRSKHKAGQIRIRLSKQDSVQGILIHKLPEEGAIAISVLYLLGMGWFQYSISLLSSHVLIHEYQTLNDKGTWKACNICVPMIPVATFFLIFDNLCN